MKKTIFTLGFVAILATFNACNNSEKPADKNANASIEKADGTKKVPKSDEGKVVEKEDHFAAIDANGDGEISKDEFTAHVKKEFAKKDTNGDGKVTKDECGKFDMFNTDGNDFISEEEFTAGHEKMFKSMDTDGSGTISKEEMNAKMKAKGESK